MFSFFLLGQRMILAADAVKPFFVERCKDNTFVSKFGVFNGKYQVQFPAYEALQVSIGLVQREFCGQFPVFSSTGRKNLVKRGMAWVSI